MLIMEMEDAACRELLARTGFGRLACVRDDRPYVVPFFFGYGKLHLYSFAMPGRKIDSMRANPHVCVQADEIRSPRAWKSVVVQGEYEELADTLMWQAERQVAWRLFQHTPNWWQPGSSKLPDADHDQTGKAIWFRILMTEVSGREADDADTAEQKMPFTRPVAKRSGQRLF
jgi:nitroimidazol reductase NimA-like FMN-containing flavoprotein (pyridoxamine 5'-phosphate oxidase superfamily)